MRNGRRNTRSVNGGPKKEAEPGSPVQRSRDRKTKAIAGLVTQGDSLLDLAKKLKTNISRVLEIKGDLDDYKDALQWFRDNEALMLDMLRSQMLLSMLSSDRKYSPIDYGIALDKSRMIRGERTFSLSGLAELVKEVEVLEVERVRLTRAAPQGGDGGDRGDGDPTSTRNSSLGDAPQKALDITDHNDDEVS